MLHLGPVRTGYRAYPEGYRSHRYVVARYLPLRVCYIETNSCTKKSSVPKHVTCGCEIFSGLVEINACQNIGLTDKASHAIYSSFHCINQFIANSCCTRWIFQGFKFSIYPLHFEHEGAYRYAGGTGRHFCGIKEAGDVTACRVFPPSGDRTGEIARKGWVETK